jgi:hypothetical protein
MVGSGKRADLVPTKETTMNNRSDTPEYVTSRVYGIDNIRRLTAEYVVFVASIFAIFTFGCV